MSLKENKDYYKCPNGCVRDADFYYYQIDVLPNEWGKSWHMNSLTTGAMAVKMYGYYDKEVTLYIYRETIILSIIGILEGYIIGYFLHSFIIHSLPPDSAMFSLDLLLSNYGLSAAITIFITLIIMIVMHFKMKHINMLDALKSVEKSETLLGGGFPSSPTEH